MNVTLKIDDELCRTARHRAVDLDQSLSRWVATLIERELKTEKRPKRTLMERLADKSHFADRPIPIPDRNLAPKKPPEFP